MPNPKPVVLTTATTNPTTNKAPEPLLVVAAATAGVAGLVVKQSALADQAASTLPTDFPSTKVQIDAVITKLNALLAKLRTAGLLLP